MQQVIKRETLEAIVKRSHLYTANDHATKDVTHPRHIKGGGGGGYIIAAATQEQFVGIEF